MTDPTNGINRRGFLRAAGRAGVGLAALDVAIAAAAEDLRAAPLDPLRGAYDLTEGLNYLNHASIGTMPRAVRRAQARYLEVCESNPWLHVWGDAWAEQWDRARGKAATVMGCAADEIAITHNTTEAFNLLAHGLPLEKGDEVDADPALTWQSPHSWILNGSVWSVGLGDTPADAVARRLFEGHGIVVRPFRTQGLNALRVSPNGMNTLAEVDALFDAIGLTEVPG